VHQQGEALSDVGTHLVDLAPWILYPEQALDAEKDLCLISAQRWPTVVSNSAFQQITGDSEFPPALRENLVGDDLQYYCNTRVNYALRGIQVKLEVLWDFEAEPGAGDTHLAVFRGSRARVEVRQGRAEKFQPELYIIPNKTTEHSQVRRAIDQRLRVLAPELPGLSVTDLGTHFRIAIPMEYRVGHEAHFAQVTKQFLRYLHGQDRLPAWEKPNMLAKYLVATRGVELSRQAKR
jgi:predicted dehydrogenase